MKTFVAFCVLFAAANAQSLNITSPNVASQIENSLENSYILNVTTNQEDGTTFTYTVNSDKFEFANNTLRNKELLLYSDKMNYSLSISVNNGTKTVDQNITVTIEKFKFEMESYTVTLKTNKTAGDNILNVTAMPGTGRAAVYSLGAAADGNENHTNFAIEDSLSGVITVATGKNLAVTDPATVYTFKAKATDGTTLTAMANVTVTFEKEKDNGAISVFYSLVLMTVSVIFTRLI